MNLENISSWLGFKLTIFGKLFIGIIIIVVMISLITVEGIRNINKLENAYNEMLAVSFKHTAFHKLKINFQQILMPSNDYLIHGNKIEQSNFEHLLEVTKTQLLECGQLVINNREQFLIDNIELMLIELEILSREIFRFSDPVGHPQGSIQMERMDRLGEKAVEEIDRFLIAEGKKMEENITGLRATNIKASRRIILIGSFISLVMFIGGAFYTRVITRPLKRLEIIARKVSEGDMSVKVKVNTNDEIEKLAESFNSMIGVLEKTTVSRGYLNSILNRMVDTLIITDAAGRIKLANKTALDLLGYQEDEIIGQHIGIILSDESCKNDQSKINKIEELFLNDNIDNIYNTYFTKTGTSLSVTFSSSLMYTNDNRISGLICIASHDPEPWCEEKRVGLVKAKTEYPYIKAGGEIPLTKRELEILRLITEGQSSNLEIANKLYISVRTVETHRRNIMQKLQVKSVISLVHYAAQNGII